MNAIRNLEKHLASLAPLRDACESIDRRLARVEDTSRQGEHTAIDEVLHDMCSQMSDRLVRVEATVQLTHNSLADSMIPETCINIERQLVQARIELQRIESGVADKTLHELCKSIDARFGRTEETLHRHEEIIAEWLQKLSADITARFAETEEAIQRLERIVSSRIGEQLPSQLASVPNDLDQVEETAPATAERNEPAEGGAPARAALDLSRFVNIEQMFEQMNRPIRQPWVARLAVPVLALVAVVATGALIRTNSGLAPVKAVPVTTSDRVVTPKEEATNQQIRAASTTPLTPDTAGPSGENRISAPPQRLRDRKPAATPSRSPKFVGTLSITSVPSGASVSINGKPAGRTPLRLSRQRAGSLAVQVAHDGFERWSAAVLVPADQLTQVTAKLRAAR
jgi:hypothetical protein